MNPTLYPVTATFACEVGDVDLAHLGEEDCEPIKQALWRYSVLIFPDQKLTAAEQLAFGDRIGPRDQPFGGLAPSTRRIPDGLTDVSNLVPDGSLWGEESRLRFLREGDKLWHTDSSFNFVPALASILYGRSIPPVGGFTEFADLRSAWRALPAAMQTKLDGLVAHHNWFHSRLRYGMVDFPEDMRAANPPSPQAIVRTIPQNGEKTLYLASHMERIFGMPDDEAQALIDELLSHATQPQFVYRHRWRQGDVLMWDNRCTMHRGTNFDDTRWTRDCQRATVGDVANTLEQEGRAIPRF